MSRPPKQKKVATLNESKDEAVSKMSRYQVPNLDRALTIMELLSQSPGMTTTEISDHLKIPKNSVFRIAHTLSDRGYLLRDEATKSFALTRKLFSLGHTGADEHSLVERSLEFMRTLRDDTKETVLIGTLLGTEGVVLEQVVGRHNFKFMVEPGLRFYLHTAAPGKAIIAHLPEKEARSLVEQLPMPRLTNRTITSQLGFHRELEKVRELGYAVDCSEEFEGQHCLAAPIFNSYSYPIASVWITAPSIRLPETDFHKVGLRIAQSAREISKRFGHRVVGAA